MLSAHGKHQGKRVSAGGRGHGTEAFAAQFVQTWLFKIIIIIILHSVGYLFLSSFTFGTRVPLAQGISWVSLCSAEHLCSLSFDDLRA